MKKLKLPDSEELRARNDIHNDFKLKLFIQTLVAGHQKPMHFTLYCNTILPF